MIGYDAIIIGGGIAGLSIGSELCKAHKILIIEEKKVGETPKTWTTEKKILVRAGFGEFITTSFKRCYLKSAIDNKFYINDVGASIDEKKLLLNLRKSVLKYGSSIEENCRFLCILRKDADYLEIKTTKGLFRTRLLIDCSGVNSILSHKYGLYKRLFYYPIYGEVYRGIKFKEGDFFFGDIVRRRFPIYWIELFPISRTECVIYTFPYVSYKKNPLKLERVHKYNIRNFGLSDRFVDRKPVRRVAGVIPMGAMKKHAVDNIFFFGDTCLIGAPIIGSGFTNILQHYRKFAKHISRNIYYNTLDAASLDYKYSEKEQMNRDLQLIIGTILLKSKPHQIDLLINALGTLPNNVVTNLIFVRLSIHQLMLTIVRIIENMGLHELAKLLPREDFFFIAKEGMKMLEDVTIEEVEELANKYPDSV